MPSTFPPIVKPGPTQRFLLVGPDVGHEAELMEGLSRLLSPTDGNTIFELTFLDSSYMADFF